MLPTGASGNNASAVHADKPTVVVLCGGRGTRLQERGSDLPKPLVEIGGRPILWHVISIYLAQGFRRFVLLTGYRGEQIEAFVAARAMAGRRRDPLPGHRRRHADRRAPAPGGPRTRRRAVLPRLRRRRRRHRPRGAARRSTQPTAPARRWRSSSPSSRSAWHAWTATGRCSGSPRSRAASSGSTPASSASSPPRWRCSSPTACSSASRSSDWRPTGRLRAFRHEGFWECMDTYKDAITLNDLWAEGRAPWKVWG